MERDVFEPYTKHPRDTTDYRSSSFDDFKNMMLPEEDVYKPKSKSNKKSLKKKGILLGLEIFMDKN